MSAKAKKYPKGNIYIRAIYCSSISIITYLAGLCLFTASIHVGMIQENYGMLMMPLLAVICTIIGVSVSAKREKFISFPLLSTLAFAAFLTFVGAWSESLDWSGRGGFVPALCIIVGVGWGTVASRKQNMSRSIRKRAL